MDANSESGLVTPDFLISTIKTRNPFSLIKPQIQRNQFDSEITNTKEKVWIFFFLPQRIIQNAKENQQTLENQIYLIEKEDSFGG